MLLWAFIEPYYPVVRQIAIASTKLHRKIRVVHVSDFHCDPEVRAEERVVEAIEKLAPDLIVFSGDGVNSDAGIPVFRKTMRALVRVAPVYAVRGNWESWYFQHVDTFANTGVVVLEDENRRVQIRDQQLWISGAAVDHEATWPRTLDQLPSSELRLAVHHFPQVAPAVGARVDVLLTGDTHGGQISLPWVGPLICIRRWDKAFVPAGLHAFSNGLRMYVSQGIGMEGGRMPRVRFLVPPEIAVLDLVPTEKN
jgi:predicted MPP superfamily phosphohydrolase